MTFKVTFLLLAEFSWLQLNYALNKFFWATDYIKKEQQIFTGQVFLEHNKINNITSQFWFLLKHLVLLYQRRCLIMFVRPTCKESSYAESFLFCSVTVFSLLRTHWMALHSLRDLWTCYKRRGWTWLLHKFLLNSVRRSASWHCKPRKWSLLGSCLLPICLSQELACLLLEDWSISSVCVCILTSFPSV